MAARPAAVRFLLSLAAAWAVISLIRFHVVFTLPEDDSRLSFDAEAMLSPRRNSHQKPWRLRSSLAAGKGGMGSERMESSDLPHGRVLCLETHNGASGYGCPAPKLGRIVSSCPDNSDNGRNPNGDIVADEKGHKDAKPTPPYPAIDKSMCVPVAEWQRTFHPTCNSFHEIDSTGGLENGRRRKESNLIEKLKELGSGKWRSAWRFSSPMADGNWTSCVLKTLNLLPRVHFDSITYERNEVDAAITDRLSPSPYIVGIFGFCGQSALNELADKTLSDEMKVLWRDALRTGENTKGTSQEKAAEASRRWGDSFLYRLELAEGAARALAYAQNVDGPSIGHPTIAHNDLRPTNYVISAGQIDAKSGRSRTQVKLNDFNAGEIVFRNATRGSETGSLPCLFRRNPPLSPYKSSPERARSLPLLPAADVYALGSVLFGLLVGRMPYSGVPKEVAWEMVKEGRPTAVPDAYAKSDDPSVQAVLRLANECWATDPLKRPSAAKISQELETVVRETREREENEKHIRHE